MPGSDCSSVEITSEIAALSVSSIDLCDSEDERLLGCVRTEDLSSINSEDQRLLEVESLGEVNKHHFATLFFPIHLVVVI